MTARTAAQTRSQKKGDRPSEPIDRQARGSMRKEKPEDLHQGTRSLPSPADTPEPPYLRTNRTVSNRGGDVQCTTSAMVPAEDSRAALSSTTADQSLADEESTASTSPGNVSPGLARLVVRLQEHYAFEQHDLSVKVGDACSRQKKTLSKLRKLSTEVSEVKIKTAALEGRLDSQLQLFQHVANFMNQVAEGKFSVSLSEHLSAPGLLSQSGTGQLVDCQQLGPAVQAEPAKLSPLTPAKRPTFTRSSSESWTRATSKACKEAAMEEIPSNPPDCRAIRSTGLRARKRKARTSSRPPPRKATKTSRTRRHASSVSRNDESDDDSSGHEANVSGDDYSVITSERSKMRRGESVWSRPATMVIARRIKGWTVANAPEPPSVDADPTDALPVPADENDPDYEPVSDVENDEEEENDKEIDAEADDEHESLDSPRSSQQKTNPVSHSYPTAPTSRYKRSRETGLQSMVLPSGQIFKFTRMGKTILHIWTEWKFGANNNPPLALLEQDYGTGWRSSKHLDPEMRKLLIKRHSNYLSVRRQIFNHVENMAESLGITPEEACRRLDDVAEGRIQDVLACIRAKEDPLKLEKK